MVGRGIILAGMLAAAAALYGCGSDDEETALQTLDERGLHLSCQTVECECVGPRESVFRAPPKAEIVWRGNGEAACPSDFELRKIETDIFGRRK